MQPQLGISSWTKGQTQKEERLAFITEHISVMGQTLDDNMEVLEGKYTEK